MRIRLGRFIPTAPTKTRFYTWSGFGWSAAKAYDFSTVPSGSGRSCSGCKATWDKTPLILSRLREPRKGHTNREPFLRTKSQRLANKQLWLHRLAHTHIRAACDACGVCGDGEVHVCGGGLRQERSAGCGPVCGCGGGCMAGGCVRVRKGRGAEAAGEMGEMWVECVWGDDADLPRTDGGNGACMQ